MPLTDDHKQWIAVQLEKLETRLLTAFHQWASPADARLRAHAAAIHALDVEQELKERLDRLDGGTTPPSAS